MTRLLSRFSATLLAAVVVGTPSLPAHADAKATLATASFLSVRGDTRILDTRPSSRIGYLGKKPAPADVVVIQVPLLSSADDAAVLNVTGTSVLADGFVTVWACDEPKPAVSNLNLRRGITTANMVISNVDSALQVCIFTQSGADLIVDLLGVAPATRGFEPVAPFRLFDTRVDAHAAGLGLGPRGAVPLDAGETISRRLRSPSVPGFPGPAAVVLNVTAVDATAPGFVTVWPCDEPRPLASSLNLQPGSTVSNAVVARIGDLGELCWYAQSGTHLVVDVFGWVQPGGYWPTTGAQRLLDTRDDKAENFPATGGVVVASLARGGVPVVADSVFVNVTAIADNAPGFVTVWPCDVPLPKVSTLNLQPGTIVANAALVSVGSAREVCIYTQARADIVVDLLGYSY